jgi:hypothetical protein
MGWNPRGAVLRATDGIGLCCEINWLIDGRCGEAWPPIDRSGREEQWQPYLP